jgi:hypothetical protein
MLHLIAKVGFSKLFENLQTHLNDHSSVLNWERHWTLSPMKDHRQYARFSLINIHISKNMRNWLQEPNLMDWAGSSLLQLGSGPWQPPSPPSSLACGKGQWLPSRDICVSCKSPCRNLPRHGVGHKGKDLQGLFLWNFQIKVFPKWFWLFVAKALG